MNRFAWVTPSTIEEAVGALEPGALVKAGGIDLMDLLKEGLIAPQRLVNLRAVEGLDRIEEKDEGLHVGPLVTLARLAANPIVQGRYRALADAAGHAATPQIRNVATVGGNLLQRPRCWYFRSEAFVCKKKGGGRCYAHGGENAYHAIMNNKTCAAVHPSATATALLALGAKLRIAGPTDAREVPLETFFVAPEVDVMRENALGAGEIITEIVIPYPPSEAGSAYLKQGEKESFDWPLAEVAVLLERDGNRCKRAIIVLGAAGPVPVRARTAEAALADKVIDDATARAAAKAAVQGATPLEQNAYKVTIFEAIVRRTILAARGNTA
ncbi:FAD binding domain-containing protein [Chondromyces apiculatus]|uniref:Periplasmic aromatic aldehyde oxidoreductase, FAD binding subunit YagS n=1 Tax=Chondromyces apiculatus DSM 436 TaxID=1192034 RepID=A0A017T1U8_9BACT|nr:FAD binding domain-containing protein [Chondromyces apiculatus]EYF02957.1 Periplasmic aromatic aldehyde oxidoreductase, FAD binding subunit YagS [Chondromyces apiculatus DSM 436]